MRCPQEMLLAHRISRRGAEDRIYAAVRADRGPILIVHPLFNGSGGKCAAAVEAAANLTPLQFLAMVAAMAVCSLQRGTCVVHEGLRSRTPIPAMAQFAT